MKLHDLVEAFDSSLELQWKSLSGGGVSASFSADAVEYTLQLVPTIVNRLHVFEVSFYLRSISGDKAFGGTGDSVTPTAVYGVVINALLEKLPELTSDGVFFSAEARHSVGAKQHEQKIRLYGAAAQRIASKLGWEKYTTQNEFLLTREYQGATIGSFKHWQEEIREMQMPCAKLVRTRL